MALNVSHWELIDNDRRLQEVLTHYADATAVAVDTEFMRRKTFYPEVALLQLCFGKAGADDQTVDNKAWLIDPLVIEDLQPLRELMQRTATVKVLHSPSEDLEVFNRWLGVLPEPLFDSQRAVAMLGGDFGLGYRALVQQYCQIDLPKGETCSDWLQRPLSQSQCEYAALDVTYLLQIYTRLHTECERRGRLDWVLADGEDALSQAREPVCNTHWRVKSAWKLKPRQLAVLAALCDWRELAARQQNRPRNWVIEDVCCLQIARKMPADRRQLSIHTKLPPSILRRHADDFLAIVEQQTRRPDAELPVALPAPLSAVERNHLKLLKQRIGDIAHTLEIAPEILLSRRDCEALIREAHKQSQNKLLPDEQLPRSWQGWRKAVVLDPLRDYLRLELLPSEKI
ncbi:MAG: ribonuclease D [Parahaliea sp.]